MKKNLPVPIRKPKQEVILPDEQRSVVISKPKKLPSAVHSSVVWLNSEEGERTTQKFSVLVCVLCLALAGVLFALSQTKNDDSQALQLAMQNQKYMGEMMGKMSDSLSNLRQQAPSTVIIDRGPQVMGFPLFGFLPIPYPVGGNSTSGGMSDFAMPSLPFAPSANAPRNRSAAPSPSSPQYQHGAMSNQTQNDYNQYLNQHSTH